MIDLKYDRRFYFNKYKSDKYYGTFSFSSKFYYLKEFHVKLEKSKNVKSISKKVEWKKLVYNNASGIYNWTLIWLWTSMH